MRNIDPLVLSEMSSLQYIPSLLIEITPNTGLPARYTSWSKDISYSGQTYYTRGIDFPSINYGGSSIVDGVTVSFDDVDRQIYGIVRIMDLKVNNLLSISVTVLNHVSFIPLGASVIWNGYIGGWSYDPGATRIRAVSVMDRWSNITTSKFSGSCRWKVFKGPECKYGGGASTCDRSYATCSSYGNVSNFGGFRWIAQSQNQIQTPESNANKDK